MFPQISWISSTTIHFVSENRSRNFGAERTRLRLSGVVMKMWGGVRACFCRSWEVVSPDRTPTRISGAGSPLSAARTRISWRGCSRFRLMSFARAFSGDTYTA